MTWQPRELIKEIRKSELAKRGFRWTESNIVYTDNLDIKYRSITFLFNEMYTWEDVDYDERILKLVFEDVEITKGDGGLRWKLKIQRMLKKILLRNRNLKVSI